MRNAPLYFGSNRPNLAALSQNFEPIAEKVIINQQVNIGLIDVYGPSHEPLRDGWRAASGFSASDIDIVSMVPEHVRDIPAMPLSDAHSGGFFVSGGWLVESSRREVVANAREGVKG